VDDYPDLLSMANAVGEDFGPEFPPGSKFWYSDAGTDSLGAVVEQASGTGLQEFVTDRLLGPLGMSDSFSYAPDGEGHPLWDRVASLYYPYMGNWTKIWEPDGSPFYPFTWGAQSLYATPTDYARFLAMWMDDGAWDGEPVTSAAAVERQLTPVSPMTNMGADTPSPTGFFDTKVWYGQMAILYLPLEGTVEDDPVVIGHSGSDGTWAWAWPDLDLMILYCTQSRGGSSGIRLEMEIDRHLIRPGYDPPVPMEYRRYVGEYLADYDDYDNEVFTVFVHNGHLAVDIPDVLFFELEEPDYRGRRFFILNPAVYVTFQDDANGNVAVMRLVEPGAARNLPRITPPENDSFGLY
jgi:CubicO group peptidase (beta-lactamase class C family)